MNYKTCYHRRRNRSYRRCRSRNRIMSMTNTLLLFLFVSMFIGVLVVQASTLSDDKYSQSRAINGSSREVTDCKMTQTSNEVQRKALKAMSTAETNRVKQMEDQFEPTPLVIETPPILSEDINIEEVTPTEVVEVESTIDDFIGERTFEFEGNTFQGYDMPNVYYPNIDYRFEPYMDYRCITNKSSPAYAISHSENAYTDEYGLRRYVTGDDQFKINDQDDYIIALGTYYKPKGECGSRYLIVTTTGMFTIITGDEKADRDTDERNMFSLHADGTCGGIVEWIVDTSCLETTMKRAGTITAGPVEALKGEITHIYRIN